MKKLLLILTLLIPSSILAETINIGWIGPLSGNSSALGVDSLAAMEMVFDEYNSKKPVDQPSLRLIAEDDKYESSKTVTAYEKLVKQDNVKAIVVVTYSGLFAIAPRAQKDGVVLIDPLDCDDKIAKLPENTLCVSKTTEDLADTISKHAVNSKNLPLGILHFEGDAFGVNMAEFVERGVKESDPEKVYREGFAGNDMDFKQSLLKFKNKGVKSLFIFGYDSFGVAMRQARDLGIDSQFYGLAVIASEGHRESAKGADEGTLVALWTPPKSDEFLKFQSQFKETIGRAPYLEISTVPSYDIAKLIVDGTKTEMITRDRQLDAERLKDYLYSIKDYKGASGNITMDSDGITRSLAVELVKFENGDFKPIS